MLSFLSAAIIVIAAVQAFLFLGFNIYFFVLDR